MQSSKIHIKVVSLQIHNADLEAFLDGKGFGMLGDSACPELQTGLELGPDLQSFAVSVSLCY